MSVKHIATTIQSAQNLFSPESVEQIIREAGTLAAVVRTTRSEVLRNGELNAREMAGRFEVEARACTSGHWGSRAMACDRDGTTQRDGFWLCDAHAANHDALVPAAQWEATCQHYADLCGRCIDCGRTWKQREESRSDNETV